MKSQQAFTTVEVVFALMVVAILATFSISRAAHTREDVSSVAYFRDIQTIKKGVLVYSMTQDDMPSFSDAAYINEGRWEHFQSSLNGAQDAIRSTTKAPNSALSCVELVIYPADPWSVTSPSVEKDGDIRVGDTVMWTSIHPGCKEIRKLFPKKITTLSRSVQAANDEPLYVQLTQLSRQTSGIRFN